MGAKHIMKTILNEPDENCNLKKGKLVHDIRDNVGIQLQRNYRTNVLMTTLGFIFISSGIALLMSFNALFEHLVKKNIVITPDSYILEYWRLPPVPLYMKLYLFNITNPEDYPWNIVKPRLQEVGPYTFQEHREKFDLQWHENNTVSYKQLVWFTFERDLSVGSQDEEILTINAPLVFANDYVKSNFMLKFMLKSVMKVMKPSFLIKRTVSQLLFEGSRDPFVKSSQLLGISNMAKYGYFVDRNGTVQEFTVNTGVGDSEKLAIIESWQGKSVQSWYPEGSCNTINGTEGCMFATYISKTEELQIFTPDVCRSYGLQYSGPSEVIGVSTYRFKLSDDTFSIENGKFNNMCSCRGGKMCHTPGLHNMSACLFGMPVFSSFPHFYKADPSLLDNFDGLHPNQHDHESYSDIEPITGVAANSSAKLQMNIYVENFDSVKDMMFPVIWANRMAAIDEPLANQFIWLTRRLHYISKVISACMMTCGMILLTFGVAYHKFAQGQWVLVNHDQRVSVSSK